MSVIASLRYCVSVIVSPVRVAIVILFSSDTKRSLYILNSEGRILASLDYQFYSLIGQQSFGDTGRGVLTESYLDTTIPKMKAPK